METQLYPDYLRYDRARKQRIKRQAQLNNLRKRAIQLAIVSLLAGAVLHYIVYPTLLQAFVGKTETVEQGEEEPAIQLPSEVSALEVKEEVKIEVVTDWTHERIVEEIHRVFPDAPIMVKVAKCEGSRHGLLDPEAFNPTNNSNDSGVFQISEKYHGGANGYRALGLTDMFDVKQNLAYARHLYDTQGLEPWKWSKHCWSK
jgi:hypothetical protein